ncbi:putative quinol monooxygenase [Sphingomonas nostoxanthinifaciens]|uniref:putative quinol monooxygenase n=1 Tax=Sphingomonas nostoxanthinifaciens TaxID=2872652 RepID=UPI001CC1EC17|nr:antibiotic biosynthesis monooxygenase [Sphingomonas nostoxanthinifaciens]
MAKAQNDPVVRMAELDIDPAQLADYTAMLAEEIETSVKIEPGVLALNAVSVKDHPAQIRILEIYADEAAYERHLTTPHFLKYKKGTAAMVRALRLIETDPIRLCSKAVSCR